MGKPSSSARKESSFKRLMTFICADHRYVFLGTCVVALGALALLGVKPSSSSFLAALPVLQGIIVAVCAAWLAVSAVALVYKLTHWRTYGTVAPFVQPRAKLIERVGSYVVWLAALVVIADRVVVSMVDVTAASIALDRNPQGFIPSAIYMTWEARDIFLRGIETTVELAIFGTIIAFFLALLLVFLRIQTPDRSDNDFVRFLKTIGNGFARLYSTVVRGTPMMVQGVVIYYAGFNLFRALGMNVSQTQAIWSFFIAGLVTISLCSAAYMAEVLRASIEAIDPGQTEAARSLGLSQWQAMRKIVFPQGVKNAIPAISNEFIINIKDSSVLSVIGVFDLMYATTSVAGIYFKQMELYVVAALAYLCLTLIAGKILNFLSARLGMGTRNVLSTEKEQR